jgi:hypothetical protein
MRVEVLAFGTYFAAGLELAVIEPSCFQESAELLVRLFDKRQIEGRVLHVGATRALIELGGSKWWLEKSDVVNRPDRWTVAGTA